VAFNQGGPDKQQGLLDTTGYFSPVFYSAAANPTECEGKKWKMSSILISMFLNIQEPARLSDSTSQLLVKKRCTRDTFLSKKPLASKGALPVSARKGRKIKG